MGAEPVRDEELVLIHAPFGRDGALIQRVLCQAQIRSEVCTDMAGLEARLLGELGAALIGDEALPAEVVKRLVERLRQQPTWSDIPLLIMTSGGSETQGSRERLRLLEPLGYVTLLERPLRPATLISTVRGALRTRRHQYEIRDLLAQRQLDSAALQKTNEELRQANAELQQFAYSASHDLQEPLRMVAIYSQLIQRKYAGRLDRDADDYIDFMIAGATRMQRLLSDLLVYAQSAAITDPPGYVDANTVLARVLDNLQAAIDESQAFIERDDLPSVQMHEVHLEQLFQNLISNSIKYRGDKKPHIQLRVRPDERAWLFSVQDNGMGIAKQYSELIFGLFKRLHQAHEYSGTGIGLALCKKIVDRYRGRIWVESEPGQGATFYFSIPQ